ncbi:protein AMBP [Bombina bombina]|uniref:protein AMBP n=1 Tax=Bombina bombina TaxID=8345 RepID=UPI00235AADAC|nr:protein AMBP [Bombina bombina]
MKSLVLLATFLVLGSCNPTQPTETIQVQENFDLPKIYGKWYDIAVGSTCKWLKQHKDKYNAGTLELSEGESSEEVKTVHTRMRHGTCSQMTGSYQKTDIPGKFNYYNPKWKVTIQNYVVFTNYDEYVIMLMKKSKHSETTTTVKLYGRTPELPSRLTEEFRQFALEQGVPEDSIFIHTNKGECTPGDIEVTHRRSQRAVLPEEEEGSGADNSPLTKNKGDSCRLEALAGPCLGMYTRYFYNTSSMACETFQYGGCLGNGNNFHAEKECLQTCRTEAACRLPVVSGPCRMVQTLWTFDSAQGKCVTFQYGGCQGNGNKFYTEKECKEYCGVPTANEDLLDLAI